MYKLRIIAGKWRNRRIIFYPNLTLKPTTNRIRETLFNWLHPVLYDTKCLDLFSGSGILSFEALSRGAKHVTIIDNNRQNIRIIKHNNKTLEAGARIHCQNALFFLKQTIPIPYDLIFIDPPFKTNYLLKSLDLIFNNNLLTKKTGLLYCESDRMIDFSTKFTIYRKKRIGNVYFYLVIIADKDVYDKNP